MSLIQFERRTCNNKGSTLIEQRKWVPIVGSLGPLSPFSHPTMFRCLIVRPHLLRITSSLPRCAWQECMVISNVTTQAIEEPFSEVIREESPLNGVKRVPRSRALDQEERDLLRLFKAVCKYEAEGSCSVSVYGYRGHFRRPALRLLHSTSYGVPPASRSCNNVYVHLFVLSSMAKFNMCSLHGRLQPWPLPPKVFNPLASSYECFQASTGSALLNVRPVSRTT